MRIEGRAEGAELREPGVEHSSGNGSGSANAKESPTLVIERSVSCAKGGSKASGPRTEQGKRRSSRNATKHGVYSEVLILRGESKAQYRVLLAGLHEALQPEGALEELLVEKLATTAWRQRRLLLAESAEVGKNMEFVESDKRGREHEAAESLAGVLAPLNRRGLIRVMENPEILESCLKMLAEFRGRFKEIGFCPGSDHFILKKIYGDRDQSRLCEDLYDSYETWLYTSEGSKEERVHQDYDSPEECKRNMLQDIEKEIRRLRRYQKARSSSETTRTQLEILRHSVPDDSGLDRLLRYEASLDRSFDRTLSQLERLQRMRLGQPVLPKLEVQHSLS